MLRSAGTLITPRRTLVRGLFLVWMLLAVGATASLAQGDADANTLLLLRFEDSLVSADGEPPVSDSGLTFEDGILGKGVLIDGADILRYASAGNISLSAGTIEFWVKPRWSGSESAQRTFFSMGSGPRLNEFTIVKAGPTGIRFIIRANDSEFTSSYPVPHWAANEWHHIAVTWKVPGRMTTYVDGVERLSHPATESADMIFSPGPIQIGSRRFDNLTPADCVFDELRISSVVRTPEEIAARYFGTLTVNSLSVKLFPPTMWKTWRATPTLTAETSHGQRSVSPATVSWSSSNPSVATVNAAGQVVPVGAGSALLTATYKGVQGSVNVNVRAPFAEPQVKVVSSLATPAAGALYEIPVVIFRYLPSADGVNLDVSWSPDFFALNPIPLSRLERELDLYDPILKFMLEEGSRFRGYGSQAAPPSLGYRVVAVITVYEPAPPGRVTRVKQGFSMYDADWFQIFERFDMKKYVNELGVKEVWFYWGGVQPEIPSYDPAVHPPENMREGWESNMSSPTTPDVSNSDRTPIDLPIYDKTYVVYGRNIRRLDAGTIHVDGHQLESMMTYANFQQTRNTEMFWQKFAGLNPDGTWRRGRGGDAHHPPNALDHYDYDNPSPFDSDIMDWKPDGGGQTVPYTSAIHKGVPYRFPNTFLGGNIPEAHWHVFWRQSMPGLDNVIPFGTNRMTNWWQFVGDWDGAMRANLGLYEPAGCAYTLSAGGQNFAAGGGSGSFVVGAGEGCRWMASSNATWVRITSGDNGNSGNTTVNFSVAPNTTSFPRATTVVVAGKTYSVTQAPAPPVLMTEQDSRRAIALASVTSLRDPFRLFTAHNFSADQRTRLMLFASGVELAPGESASAVTAQAEDSQQRVFPLTVEYVGKVPGLDWLTQINVRLPDGLDEAGDVWVSISLRGTPSNKALVNTGPSR